MGIHQLPGGGRPVSRQQTLSRARANLCINCVGGKCRRGLCKFLLQKTTEGLLSPVPTAGRALVNPPFSGGGPFLDSDAASAPVVRGATKSDEARDAIAESNEAVESPSPQIQLTEVSICPFLLEGSNCSHGENCRYCHSFRSGAEGFYLVASPEAFQKPITGIALPADAENALAMIVPGATHAGSENDVSVESSAPQSQMTEEVRACRFFLNGSHCDYGADCRYRHSFSTGADDFYLVRELQGYRKPIMGIALPSGSNKLFVCSIDTVKILDYESSQCIWMKTVREMAKTEDRRCRFSSLIGVDTWVFLGFPGVLKIWNFATGIHLSLEIPGGRNRVYAIAFGIVNGDEFLFGGLQEGSIMVWKWNATVNVFETVVCATCSLAGAHSLAIRSLVLRDGRLYSGSMDSTIKVWDLANLHNPHFLAKLKRLQTLTGHTDSVTSILFWNQFLLSGSFDGTVRVWATAANTDSFHMDLIYTHKTADHVVALSLMNDANSSPVLMCSCNDSTVYLYNLPSFAEKGRIFSSDELRQMVTGPEGLFFTGNMSGELKVWKWRTGSGY